MFGEGVVNDAVSILIYQAVAQMIESSSEDAGESKDLPITAGLIGLTVWAFLYISVLSVLSGVGFGLISAFVSKFFTTFHESPPKEVFLILLFSYL